MAGKARKRPSRATGIGRGHGDGSKAGQFQRGEPSRNPGGRPPKVKRAINPDMRDLFREMLSEEVAVRENGVSRVMQQQQAMIKMMLNGFPQASHRDQLAIMRFILTNVTPSSAEGEIRNGDIPPQPLREFIEELAREHERLQLEGLA